MTSTIQGEGVLWVQSRISPSCTDILDEPTFLKWYDEDHIPEVISTSGIKSGFRYINVNRSPLCSDVATPKPFLAFYPMSRLDFTLSEEFKNIRIQSDILPGSGIVYDFADFDVSYLGFLSATAKKKNPAVAPYIVTSEVRSTSDMRSEIISDGYEKTTAIKSLPGYLRTLRFESQYARSNAQSRALKGLPATEATQSHPATWLAIHEFSEVPEEGTVRSLRENFEDMPNHAGPLQNDVHIWKLAKAHGVDKIFV